MRKASVENQLSFAKTQAKLSTSAMNIIGHILTPQLKGPYDPSIPTLVPEGVALLGIVNTIDEANSRFYKDFESIQEDYVIPDFYNITKSHRMVIDELKSQFGSGRTQCISRLRRFCPQRYDDMEEEAATTTRPSFSGGRRSSRGGADDDYEDYGTHFPGASFPAGSVATCGPRRVGQVWVPDRSRLHGPPDAHHLCSWEAKTTAVGSEQLRIQRRKIIHLDACIAVKTFGITEAAGSKGRFPQRSPIILDIEGLRALPYILQKIKPGLFGTGAVTSPTFLICQHCYPYSIYSQLVKAGVAVRKRDIALAKMLGKRKEEPEGCIINTPTKVQKRPQHQCPTGLSPSPRGTATKRG
ncbi:hypothetical protein EDD21DRAFT_358200 [Dissophora ornata]|nr:hypothetical protein EDD21DRAFT_358200 [Dissophora ornata]